MKGKNEAKESVESTKVVPVLSSSNIKKNMREPAAEKFLRECGFCRRQIENRGLVQTEEVEQHLRDFVANIHTNMIRGNGLTILGGLGVGKTTLLCSIAYRIWVKLRNPDDNSFNVFSLRYVTINSLVNELVAAQKEGRAHPPYGHNLIFLDDFGRENSTEWTDCLVEDWFDFRYNERLPVILTSNMTVEMLRQNMQYSRIVDRLRETNKTIVISSDSHRKSK